MANPVFSRAEAFQPHGNPYGQPLARATGRSTACLDSPVPSGGLCHTTTCTSSALSVR